MYGYIASHNQGRTLVLSDGRVFEERRGEWYLFEEGVAIEDYAIAAANEWDADWTEIDEEEIFQHIDAERDYYIGEPPRN